MPQQFQNRNVTDCEKTTMPVEFITICVIAFIAGVLTTAYFCYSMGFGMKMPGGWTMSMMWMRMPGQTWFTSMLCYMLMWLAMMVAMMMLPALPTFLKTRRKWTSHCYMATGYFAIWLIAGIAIYPVGVWLAKMEMKSEPISRAVPLLSGAILIVAGAIQFTRWKRKHLLGCRSQFGCAAACPEHEKSFRLGCEQGATCFACCAAPMTILLVLGIMNPLAMILITIVITAEKLLPRPEITARVVGSAAIVAGIIMTIHWASLTSA
ncbi:MAG: DUF2182 domain-containing protein [Ginsengibacter sp.]